MLGVVSARAGSTTSATPPAPASAAAPEPLLRKVLRLSFVSVMSVLSWAWSEYGPPGVGTGGWRGLFLSFTSLSPSVAPGVNRLSNVCLRGLSGLAYRLFERGMRSPAPARRSRPWSGVERPAALRGAHACPTADRFSPLARHRQRSVVPLTTSPSSLTKRPSACASISSSTVSEGRAEPCAAVGHDDRAIDQNRMREHRAISVASSRVGSSRPSASCGGALAAQQLARREPAQRQELAQALGVGGVSR